MKRDTTLRSAPLGLAIAAFSFCALARAGDTAALPFLNLDPNARSAGLGGAWGALVNDPSALFLNPAALQRVTGKSAIFSHATHINSSYFDFAGYAQPLGNDSALGVGIQYFSIGSVDQTDNLGNNTGTLSPADIALGVGYARNVKGISLGLTGKYIRSELDDAASAFALDLGFVSPLLFAEKRLRFAASATNLGSGITYSQEKQALPTRYRAGGAYRIRRRWDAAMDLVVPKNGDAFLALGSEFFPRVAGDWAPVLRVGYNNEAQHVDGTAGWAGGFGLFIGKIRVEYALVSMGDLGLGHRLSLSYRPRSSEINRDSPIGTRNPSTAP